MIALIPNCAFLSETSRMLIIGQALRQRGMPVAFASHGGPFTHVLEQAGESVTRLEPVQSDDEARQWVEGVVNLGRPGLRLQTAQEVRASVQSEVAFLRDTGAKLEDYFSLPSLQHYLIVKTENGAIIHHQRNPDGTILTRINRGGPLHLDPPGITLTSPRPPAD